MYTLTETVLVLNYIHYHETLICTHEYKMVYHKNKSTLNWSKLTVDTMLQKIILNFLKFMFIFYSSFWKKWLQHCFQYW